MAAEEAKAAAQEAKEAYQAGEEDGGRRLRQDRGEEGRPQDNYESIEEFKMAIMEANAAAQEAIEAKKAEMETSSDDSGRRLHGCRRPGSNLPHCTSDEGSGEEASEDDGGRRLHHEETHEGTHQELLENRVIECSRSDMKMLRTATKEDLADEEVELPRGLIFQSCTHQFVEGEGDYYTSGFLTLE